jgi:TonB-dependent starch-binding outer membrane protein SusC
MKTILSKLLLSCLLLPLSILAQTVTGVVTDESKMPMPGVNVIVKGTTNGASTDFDGKFTLSKLKKGDVIEFSYVGYSTKDITYNNEKTLNVSLVEDTKQLKEVVLVSVGYGTVRKKDVTGSVELITTKDFNRGANFNAENLLNGRAAGLVIAQGGRPGDGAAIRIRGGSSLGASNEPLIVLDGMPLDKAVGGVNGVLSSLNPNDIEGFSILKDASATAIYGSRGSNGVIIINTKKGKRGALQVSLGTTLTLNTLAKKVDVLSADQFRGFVENPSASGFSSYVIENDRKKRMGTASTDWQDEIFDNSVTMDNNLSLRGALFDKIPSAFSFGHTYIPGILNTSRFNRQALSARLNPSFFDDHLKIAVNANFTVEKNRYANDGAIGAAISFDPTQPVRDPRSIYGGYFEWTQNTIAGPNNTLINNYADFTSRNALATSNPVAMLEQQNNTGKSYRFFGNSQIDYKLHFFPEVTITSVLGVDNQYGRTWNTLSNQSRNGFIPNGTTSLGIDGYNWEKRHTKLSDLYANYKKTFNKLDVDFTAGYSYQQTDNYSAFDNNTLNVDADRNPLKVRPDVNLQSFFGRMNLGYDDKYLVTLNYRRDGTSRFSKQNRWGNFPGAAFAWKMSNESFLKDVKTVQDLKLRIGWGITGQQDVNEASFNYVPLYQLGNAQGQYGFGNQFYITARPQGYNEGLKWEETTTANIGLDFNLFSKVRGTLDAYRRTTKDLIARVPFPDGANLSNSGFRNFGDLRSDGIELGLNFDLIKRDNMNWNINFNATYQDREITSLARDSDPNFIGEPTGGIQGGVGNTIQIHTSGYAPNSFFVMEQVYGANGKPIEGAYVDRNGDGIVNLEDRYHHKKPYADFLFGLMSNFSYKDFDFAMSWRASLGNYIYDNVSSSRGFLDSSFGLITPVSNVFPDAIETGFVREGNNRLFSDHYIKDASFIKLDNITVGYTFRDLIAAKTNFKINFGIQNALIISNYKGIDPELFSGIDGVIYPRARMFIFGANVSF